MTRAVAGLGFIGHVGEFRVSCRVIVASVGDVGKRDARKIGG